MSGKSSEQVAFQLYRELPPHDRRLVKAWLDRTRCGWVDAVLNSGVTTRSRRTTPEDGLRAAARAEADETMERYLRLVQPLDAVGRRRRSAEHEASHSIVAAAFGMPTRVAFLGRESGGAACIFDGRLTGLARAAVALAPAPWFEIFRADEYRSGAVGMDQDRRDAAETGCDLQEARKIATEILRDERAAVMALADKIDNDGHWFGD